MRTERRLGTAMAVYVAVWLVATFGTFAALEWTGHRDLEARYMPWLMLAAFPAPFLGACLMAVMAARVFTRSGGVP